MADMPNEQGERAVRDEARRLAGEAALVIDPRLADLWQMIWTRPGEPADQDVPLWTVAALLRLAYAMGYADAQGEERAGALYEELGLRPPISRRTSERPSHRGRAGPGNSDK